MIKEALKDIKDHVSFLVEEYAIIHDHETQFRLKIEALESLITKQKPRGRRQFPKTFRIVQKNTFDAIEQEIPGAEEDPIFCSKSMYDVVVEAVINMQSKEINFNRFSLHDAAKEICNHISIPAILVCYRYWMSMGEPLLYKPDGSDLFAVSCDVDDFQVVSSKAWDELVENELTITAPRGFI